MENKTKKKLFNIFEKKKQHKELSEVGSGIAKTINTDIQLAEKGTVSLRSEEFVDKIPDKSPVIGASNKTKDYVETKVICSPLKKKPKVSKSPSFIGKIDKYFINQSVKPPVDQSTNSLHTTMKNEGNKKPKEKKNKISNCLEKPSNVQLIKSPHSTEKKQNASHIESLHSDYSIDNLIESIDTNAIYEMLCSRKLGNGTPVLQNDDSHSVSKLTPKKQDKIRKGSQETLCVRENNNPSQIKSSTDIPKIKQQVSDCSGLVLLKKKAKKSKINTIQTMTNNSASYLSENVQKTTENISSEFVKETSKKISRRPTICKTKLDDQNESLEYREPKPKKVRRLTICNTNMEDITSTSKGIETIEYENDLEKINEKTHLKKEILKNNKISTENTKIKKHVSDNESSILLKKRVRKASIDTSQSMTNNTASSINDDKLNIHSISSDSYLSENLQETINNITSESVKETPKKRGRRPTICKTKLDDQNESSEYSEPKPKKVKRLTICNTNMENIACTSKEIETIENENDLEKINEKTHLKKEILKNSKISTENTKIKKHVSDNESSILLKKRVRKASIDTSQSMTNNTASSISDDKLNTSDSYLSENQQETINNVTSESVKETPKKRGRRPTICKTKFNENESFEYKGPKPKKVRRLTICNTNMESITSTETVAGFNIENQNDLEKINEKPKLKKEILKSNKISNQNDLKKINEKTHLKKGIIKNNEIITDKSKITEHVAENGNSVLLKKRVRKANMDTSQCMTNNTASSISDDQLNICSITSDSYLSENLQETINNITSDSVKVTPKKRGRRPTICKTKLDDQNESLEYREPKPKRVRRLTICNTNMESITSTETVAGFNIENQNDLEKINEKTHLKKGIIKNNEIITDKSKITEHVAENGNSVLLKKGVRKANMNTSQCMTNNTASSISDDQLNICSITSDSYLSENLQETINNVTSDSVKVTPKKRGRRPTICKTKLDDQNESLEYRESKPKKVRRLTICNANMENVTSISKGIETVAECKIENQNDLEKVKEKAQLKKGIIKNNVISTDNTNIDSTTTDDQMSFSNLPEESQKTVENKKSESFTSSLRESARIKKRRLTISNISLTSNDFKETDIIDNKEVTSKINRNPVDCKAKEMETANDKESPKKRGRRRTICLDTLNTSVLEPIESLDVSDTVKINRDNPAPKSLEKVPKDNENSAENVRSNSVMINNISDETNTVLREEQTFQGIKQKRGRPQSEKSICGATEVVDTSDNIKTLKKRGRRPTICKGTLEKDVKTSEINRDKHVLKNITKISNDNEILTENSNTNLSTNTELKESQAIQEQKTKRGRPRSNKSVCKAKVVDTTDYKQFLKKKRRRPTICKETSEGMETSENLSTVENNRDLQAKEKNDRPQSVKSVKTIVRKYTIRKINVARQPKKTEVNLSKNKLNSVNIRKIPQDRLDDVLAMLEDEDHPVWNDRNVSCNAGIHHYWDPRTIVSEQNMKMKLAREFLLRRDWLSVAKILCLPSQEPKNNVYYPLLVKYATLCLAYTDKEQFNTFVKSLMKLGDDIDIIKKCTNISR